MPPTQNNRDAILENIETTLKAIAVSDDYNYTPVIVTREALPFDAVEFYPTYVILDGPEDITYVGKRVVNYFTVLIRVFHKSERGMGYSTILNNMVADIRAALAIDVTRGDNATNTEVIHIESDEGWLAPIISCELTVRIQYLTIEVYR